MIPSMLPFGGYAFLLMNSPCDGSLSFDDGFLLLLYDFIRSTLSCHSFSAEFGALPPCMPNGACGGCLKKPLG
jgi:hypothetical protein